MKENVKKIISGVLLVIVMLNLIFLVRGYFIGKAGNNSFSNSLAPVEFNFTPCVITLLVLHFLAFLFLLIVIFKKGIKKGIKIVGITAVILLVGIAVGIPVRGVQSITYTISKDAILGGSTTYHVTYLNLYGINLTEYENTKHGIDVQ